MFRMQRGGRPEYMDSEAWRSLLPVKLRHDVKLPLLLVLNRYASLIGHPLWTFLRLAFELFAPLFSLFFLTKAERRVIVGQNRLSYWPRVLPDLASMPAQHREKRYGCGTAVLISVCRQANYRFSWSARTPRKHPLLITPDSTSSPAPHAPK